MLSHSYCVLLLDGRGIDGVGDSHHQDAQQGDACPHQLRPQHLLPKEEEGEQEGGDDGAATQHLVGGGRDEVEGHELHGGGEEVEEGRDEQIQFVHAQYLPSCLCFLCPLQIHLRGSCLEAPEHQQGHGFGEKHDEGLLWGESTWM